jgi:predicted N-acetyltransferase YhbS
MDQGISGLHMLVLHICCDAASQRRVAKLPPLAKVVDGNAHTVNAVTVSQAGVRTEIAGGGRYLALATTLLQRMRLADPTGGIWEAADVQWWSRQERATDEPGQLFWLDEAGQPVGAVIRTEFHGRFYCDVLVLPGRPAIARMVWRQALGEDVAAIGFPVRDDDETGINALTEAGFLPSGEKLVSSWLAAADRPRIPGLLPGYRLMSRAGTPDRSHHLAARNGARVAERLQQCSLYRPELDLVVLTRDGRVAGYGLFWADPVTRVGLVEPMRTEDEFQRQGIAGHVLAVGLDLLAEHGCDRLKVSNDIPLYLRAGFRPLAAAAATVYRHQAAAGTSDTDLAATGPP